ncbi:hypothetical protein ACS0TY_015414 [Phlomoides rotata]
MRTYGLKFPSEIANRSTRASCERSRHVEVCLKLPSSVSLLWNVHTLIFKDIFDLMYAPSEILYMRQLRYAEFYRVVLLDPPPSDQVGHLPNLQRLSAVVNSSFTEEVCKRISNIKKLGVVYTD